MARPETVVDYDAWRKGYTPPSEHVLIDQLAYRGARVVLASDWGEPGAFWIVMRGKTPSPAVRKAMREMLEIMFAEEEPEKVLPAKPASQHDGAMDTQIGATSDVVSTPETASEATAPAALKAREPRP